MSLTGIEAMYARPSFSPVWITITVVIVLRHLGVLALVAGRTTNARPRGFRKKSLLARAFLKHHRYSKLRTSTERPRDRRRSGQACDSYRRNIDLYLTKKDFFKWE